MQSSAQPREPRVFPPWTGPDLLSAMTPAAKRAVLRFLTVYEVGCAARWSFSWSRGLRGLLRHDAQLWFQRFLRYVEGASNLNHPFESQIPIRVPIDLCLTVATPDVHYINAFFPTIALSEPVRRVLAAVLPTLRAFDAPMHDPVAVLSHVIDNAPHLETLSVYRLPASPEAPLRVFEPVNLRALSLYVQMGDLDRTDATSLRVAETVENMTVNCARLLALDICDSFNSLTPSFYEKVGRACPHILALRVQGTGFSRNCSVPLNFFPSLRSCTISAEYGTAGLISQLEAYCPLLDDVSLDVRPPVATETEPSPSRAAQALVASLISLIRARPAMRSIILSSNLATDDAMLAISQSCPLLRRLHVRHNPVAFSSDARDFGILAVFGACTLICDLRLTSEICSVRVLQALYHALPHLRDFGTLAAPYGLYCHSMTTDDEFTNAWKALITVRPALVKAKTNEDWNEYVRLRRMARLLPNPLLRDP